MTFPTKIVDLAGGAIDLVADPDIAAEIAAGGANGTRIFVQNISTSTLYFSSQVAEPGRTDAGHVMAKNDAFVIQFTPAAPNNAWLWVRSTGQAAISPGN